MKVEVKEPLALERNRVQPTVQLGERQRMGCEPPRPPPELGEHRRPVDALEHERVVAYLEHGRHREAVGASMLHHLRFAIGPTARLETPEHTAVAELEDLRGAPLRQHPHGP